jgi:hypothetical protein
MTNRSTRALFYSKTLNTALRAFSFPQDMEVRRQKLGTWIAALKTGTLDEIKEVSLHGSCIYEQFFLADWADIAAFKQFYFLLCRRNFLPQNQQAKTSSVIDRLLKDSEEVQ